MRKSPATCSDKRQVFSMNIKAKFETSVYLYYTSTKKLNKNLKNGFHKQVKPIFENVKF